MPQYSVWNQIFVIVDWSIVFLVKGSKKILFIYIYMYIYAHSFRTVKLETLLLLSSGFISFLPEWYKDGWMLAWLDFTEP